MKGLYPLPYATVKSSGSNPGGGTIVEGNNFKTHLFPKYTEIVMETMRVVLHVK